jgi:N-hydroxyarylamine O-acetyltransferase
VDVDAYLARIGLTERPIPTAESLAQIQRAQRLCIPFENLDIPLKRGISLDPEAIFDKLVTRRRGGYCFEQNQLFHRVLLALGFDSRPLMARTWLFAGDAIPPRSHTFNLVKIDGEEWIADAGFSSNYTAPMRLRDGETVASEPSLTHRLNEHPEHGWMVERDAGKGFQPQYSFSLDRVYPIDLEMANHWTSTCLTFRFTQNVIVSIVLPHGTASLMNLSYTRESKNEKVASEITSPRMLQMRLSLIFGIELSLEEVGALGLF